MAAPKGEGGGIKKARRNPSELQQLTTSEDIDMDLIVERWGTRDINNATVQILHLEMNRKFIPSLSCCHILYPVYITCTICTLCT